MAKASIRLSAAQKTTIACMLLFLVLLLAGLLVNIVRSGELSARARALESEIARLEEEKKRNSELLADLNSKDFADAYAHEYLDLKKKGAQIYKGEET
jgi:cell division protein FtsB